MSEKSNPDRGEPAEAQSNESESAAADEKVGPGHPPRHTRFQKGGPSPNPRGRPRKDQSMLSDLRKIFEQALNKKIQVSRGDRKVLVSKLEIGIEQLANQFTKGDRKAWRDVMECAGKLGIDLLAKHRATFEEALAPSHQAILDSYVARRTGNAEAAPATRVLASPELLDDDAVAADAAEAEAPAITEPEPEPEPLPKPGVNYPKPFSEMTMSARAAWYPEWYAKKLQEEQERARAKQKTKAQANEKQAVQSLDQASYGRGVPPPGGFSVTTKKPT